MKHLLKLLLVTFLMSTVSVLFAQGAVDKKKDEVVNENTKNEKSAKGDASRRILGDETAPATDKGNDEIKADKKSFFGRLFGGKSTPEGQSSKAAAGSRSGAAKSSAAPSSMSSDKPKSDDKGKSEGAENEEDEKEEEGVKEEENAEEEKPGK